LDPLSPHAHEDEEKKNQCDMILVK